MRRTAGGAGGRIGLLLLSCLLPCRAPAQPADASAFLDPSQVHPGMRGVAYTVFEGTRPRGFAVEFLGVINGARPKGDLILFRAISDTLAQVGVVQGMSGSPVYADGKLVGAIAFSFPYAKEAMGMITPIGEMVEGLSRIEQAPGPWMGLPTALHPRLLKSFLDGTADPSVWEAMAPGAADEAGAPTLLGLCGSGWAPEMRTDLEGFAKRMGLPFPVSGFASAAAADSGGAADLVPGSAIGFPLIDGDASLAGIGTVTYRRGDQIIALGHPIFQAGPVAFPFATARVHAIVPAYSASFKLASVGPIVGTIRQDLRSGVTGKIGEIPPMMPFRLQLTGPSGPRTYRYRVARGVLMEPTMLAWAVTNSFLEQGWKVGEASVDARLAVHYNGTRTLERRDRLASKSPSTEIAEQILSPVPLLLTNPFEPVQIDSVDLEVGYSQILHESILVDFWAERAKVRPGEELALTARLQDRQGGTRESVVRIPVPERWRGRSLLILAGGAQDLTDWDKDRAPSLYTPKNLEGLERLIREFPDGGDLLVRVYGEEDGVLLGDREIGPLPGSIARVLGASHKRGPARTAPDFRLEERRIDAGGTVSGGLAVRVQVQ